MTAFEIFAIAWIPIAVAIVMIFAFSAERIEKRLGLDKPITRPSNRAGF